MKKSKKIIIYLIVILVTIIMLSLFYYSMRATLMDYFFENNQNQRNKMTSASSDQAKIMVDLANKQLAKQQEETEIRKDEVKNKSLFNELSVNQSTIKTAPDESSSNVPTPEIGPQNNMKNRNLVENGFVVVDCKSGGVIACPHYDVQTGTSPSFYQNGNSRFLVGKCLDVSIDLKSFCP